MPGTEFTAQIAGFPLGTSEGSLDTRDGLPRLRELRGSTEYPVLIAAPEEIDISKVPFGSSGTALVLTDKAGPIGIIAEVLFWVTKQMNYL